MTGDDEPHLVLLREPFPEVRYQSGGTGEDIGRKNSTGYQDAHTPKLTDQEPRVMYPPADV